MTYWIRNLDNLMIGKLIGQETLGIYNMAYQNHVDSSAEYKLELLKMSYFLHFRQ